MKDIYKGPCIPHLGLKINLSGNKPNSWIRFLSKLTREIDD
jgi:hypothetical protein